jgi:hypothetical protein
MNAEEFNYLAKCAHQTTIYWRGTGQEVTRVIPILEEDEDLEGEGWQNEPFPGVAFLGGPQGGYIALYNVDIEEFYVGLPFPMTEEQHKFFGIEL